MSDISSPTSLFGRRAKPRWKSPANMLLATSIASGLAGCAVPEKAVIPPLPSLYKPSARAAPRISGEIGAPDSAGPALLSYGRSPGALGTSASTRNARCRQTAPSPWISPIPTSATPSPRSSAPCYTTTTPSTRR